MITKTIEADIVPAFLPLYDYADDPSIRYFFSDGGRGGAKSFAIGDFLIFTGRSETARYLCTREIQDSIRNSVHSLLKGRVNEYGLSDWTVNEKRIYNSFTNTELVFNGLSTQTEDTIKSFFDIKRCWVEEAQSITDSSLKILRPTIRSPGSKIYFSFNRKSLRDPVYDLFLRHKTKKYKMKFTDENGDSFYWFLHKGDGCIRIEINWDGNPFFPNELNNDRLLDLETQPVEEYQHVWEGLPEPQPKDSVVDVTECNNAMKRTIIPKGDWSIGVDVARSGKDKVDIFVRRGMTVTKMVEFKNKSKNEKMRTWETAERVMKLSDEISPHKDIPIKVDDTGVGGGVTDYLEKFGYNVIPVNFQQKAIDEEHYANAISEMWFTFNKIINQVDIPDNKELLEDLTNRSEIARDNKSRRRIEPKDIFKKRMGRSPDKGDGLLLCFYEPEQATIGFITVRQ